MLTAIIIGAGHRALTYASYAQEHPDQLRIVGVADPMTVVLNLRKHEPPSPNWQIL